MSEDGAMPIKSEYDEAGKRNSSFPNIGRVEECERKVIFEPEGITLPPPGD